MRLIDRLYNYERILQEVIIYLVNGGFVIGTVARVHYDFVTISTLPKGAMDIPYTSILSVAPIYKEKT